MDGHFIITYTGKKFIYESVRTLSIDIVDIAHSLSHLCRFTGHTSLFWSVAQHSLLVAEKIPGDPEEKLAALLHDAAEAYTNDLTSPLKRYLWGATVAYHQLQELITKTVFKRFGCPYQSTIRGSCIPDSVYLYDRAACVYEAEGFMGLSEEELQKFGYPIELRDLWEPWDPRWFASKNGDREFGQVETEFLHRFETLMKACGREHLM